MKKSSYGVRGSFEISKEVCTMDVPAVYIRKECVLNMIYSAVETGRRECAGELWGKLPSGRRKHFLVDNAVTWQLIDKRKNKEFTQNVSAANRLAALRNECMHVFPRIGFFHSHAQWMSTLKTSELSEMSEDDMNQLDDLGYLEIIIAVCDNDSSMLRWEAKPDGSIEGSVLRKKFSLHAYCFLGSGEEKVLQKIRIISPGALRSLNRILKKK